MRIALALGERDGDSLDSYDGPPAWRDEARRANATLAQVRRDTRALLADLESSAGSGPDDRRRSFLVRQLRAIDARIGILQGDRPPLADEAAELFGIDVRRVPAVDAAPIHDALERELPGAGALATRLADFERRFIVPADRLPRVVDRAIAECRSVTAAHLALPAGERVEVSFVDDLAWSAYTRHDRGFVSRVQINRSLPLTVDRALDLACHETYPGHHAIGTLVEARLAGRVEFQVQPTFSPQSALQEGLASGAGDLAFTETDRLRLERDVLFPLADLPVADVARHIRVSRLVDALHDEEARVAQQYLDGHFDFAQASRAFAERGLMASPDATIMFLNRFRSYAITYTVGRDLVWNRLRGSNTDTDADNRWRAFAALVTDPRQTVE